MDAISPNTTVCIADWINFYYSELPLLQVRLHYASTDDAIFNITSEIKNISSHLSVCTDAIFLLYNYTYTNIIECPSGSDYGMAFMQNILGNIININTIYQ